MVPRRACDLEYTRQTSKQVETKFGKYEDAVRLDRVNILLNTQDRQVSK